MYSLEIIPVTVHRYHICVASFIVSDKELTKPLTRSSSVTPEMSFILKINDFKTKML